MFLVLALAAAAGLGWWLTRMRLPMIWRFAILNFLLLAGMVVTAKPEKFELLPQVGRLHLEMEMGACIILGSCAWSLYKLIPAWLHPVVLVLLLAPLYLQIEHYRARARMELQPVDLATRSEFTSARWVGANLAGQRTYVIR